MAEKSESGCIAGQLALVLHNESFSRCGRSGDLVTSADPVRSDAQLICRFNVFIGKFPPDPESGIEPSEGVHVIQMPRHVSYFQSPVIYTLPLQLLAYHAAVLRGTDVDQPRNLAKSVTVE